MCIIICAYKLLASEYAVSKTLHKLFKCYPDLASEWVEEWYLLTAAKCNNNIINLFYSFAELTKAISITQDVPSKKV